MLEPIIISEEQSEGDETQFSWVEGGECRVLLVPNEPLDEEGNLRAGFVEVGRHSDGRIYYDVTPNVETPDMSEVVSSGIERFMPDRLGAHKDRILEATYTKTNLLGRNPEPVREKMHQAKSRLPRVTLEQADIRPHKWLGE